MSEVALPFGDRVGDYHLLRELGRGAMGVVFEARAPGEAIVALKLLVPPPLLPDAEREGLQRRFTREARALSAIDHPNVVRVHEFGEAGGNFYLAMELLDGANLRELLSGRGPLPPAEAVSIAVQLCRALEAVHHAGIIHRDVKPENVIVLRDGTVKLTDFGVAWMENEATLTRTGGILGSPAYMSPEQILGRSVDRRSDVFSVAATLYQLLTDRLPFTGSGLMEMAHNVAYADPSPLPSDIPRAIVRVVEQGLQKTPAARFASAADLAGALERALAAPSGNRVSPPSPVATTPTFLAQVVAPAQTPTVHDAIAWCARHPRRHALGYCQACGRSLCSLCTRQTQAPHFCALHAPVTVCGINLVRLEVALMAAFFLLLLLVLSPLGYAFYR